MSGMCWVKRVVLAFYTTESFKHTTPQPYTKFILLVTSNL